MRKIGWIASCAAFVLLSCPFLPSARQAKAAGEYTVTYRVAGFSPVTRTVHAGSAAEELLVSDLHRGLPGRAFGEGEMEWFADADYKTVYTFEDAVTEDTTLYGRVRDVYRVFRSDGYGWDVASGKVYAGDPVDDKYVTTDVYVSPTYTDPETGDASFTLNPVNYAVYGRGFSVGKPFTVTVTLSERPEEGAGWLTVGLYPSLTLAQAGAESSWASVGATAALMTDVVSGNVQPFVIGSSVAGHTCATETVGTVAKPFEESLTGEGNSFSFTCEITDEGTLFSREDGTVIARSPAAKKDYAAGKVWLSFASNNATLGFTVSLRGEAGKISVLPAEGVTAGEVSVNGMAVTLPVTVEGNGKIGSVKANGTEIALIPVYGKEGVYAVDLTEWGTDVTLEILPVQEEPAKRKGCKSAAELPAVAGVCLSAAIAVGLKRKKRG